MERIASLIQELQDAYQQRAEPGKLLLLVNELQSLFLQQSAALPKEKRRVVVLLPGIQTVEKGDSLVSDQMISSEKEEKNLMVLEVDEQEVAQELNEPEIVPQALETPKEKPAVDSKTKSGLLFDWEDGLQELPTFVHQEGTQETEKQAEESVVLGEEMNLPTLNERLATTRNELADQLGAAPIKDLRKAIGLNDRFVFINELFRGDETMYDRSIKTINNFAIYAEAQYWMERELKVKLGWDNGKSVTQEFYALVRRRFA
jgi:hypothetical protein